MTLYGHTDRYPLVESIIAIVAKHYNVTRLDMKSARRTANVVRPRHVAMYFARNLTLKSLPHIGRCFGGRDHTTVLHAVRKIDGLIRTDAGLAHDVAYIELVIGVAI
jgi:chromosomal replication initiator protein